MGGIGEDDSSRGRARGGRGGVLSWYRPRRRATRGGKMRERGGGAPWR